MGSADTDNNTPATGAAPICAISLTREIFMWYDLVHVWIYTVQGRSLRGSRTCYAEMT